MRTLNIVHDSSPENPFENWDGLFPCITEYDGYTKDYSKGDIDRYLQNYLSYN